MRRYHAYFVQLSFAIASFSMPSFGSDILKPPANRDRNCTGIASIMECLSQATIDPRCTRPISPSDLATFWQNGCSGHSICGKLRLNDGTVVSVTDPKAIEAAARIITDNYKKCATEENNPNLPQPCNSIPGSIPNGQCVSFSGAGTDSWPDKTTSPTVHAMNICKDASGKVYILDSSCDPSKIDVPPASVGPGSASYPCTYNGSDPAKRGKTSQRSYRALGMCSPVLKECFDRNGVKCAVTK